MRCLRDQCLLLAAVVAATCFQNEVLAEAGVDEAEPITAATELMQIYDVVLEHHISPPTRQQMAHDSIQELYRTQNQVVPASIASEISEARDRAELLSVLSRELQKFGAGNVFHHPHRLGPHGVTLTSAKAHLVNQQLAANRYVGIGIAIADRFDDCPTMFRIVPGGSADLSGAKEGDEIVEVAGNPTKSVPLTQVIDWIRGPEGTDVELVLRRNGGDMRVTMTRKVVPIKTIKPPVVSKSGRTVGVEFERVSASNLHELKKIEANLDSQTETVVLDFRFRTGARELHYGELLADALIDDAEIGTIVRRDGTTRAIHAGPGRLFDSKLLYIVVNDATGPVLKWIAAALQDSGQASVIGAPATQPAVAADTITIPSGTVTVTVPSTLLARRDGELLSPVNGVFGQLSIAFRGVLAAGVSPPQAASMRPAHRPLAARVPGVVYPDQAFLPRFPRVAKTSRMHSLSTTSKLAQIVEKIDENEIDATDSTDSGNAES